MDFSDNFFVCFFFKAAMLGIPGVTGGAPAPMSPANVSKAYCLKMLKHKSEVYLIYFRIY